MIIKLISTQIPIFWEVIKRTVIEVDSVKEKDIPDYLLELLTSLLSDKAQCFVRFDEDRILTALLITRIMENKFNKRKYIFVQCLYSFKVVSDDIWESDWKFVSEYAISEGCDYISYDSGNKKIWELTEKLGFREVFRTYHYYLRGAK